MFNAAERYAKAVWRQHCPGQDAPPIWIHRFIFPSRDDDSFRVVTFPVRGPHLLAPRPPGPDYRAGTRGPDREARGRRAGPDSGPARRCPKSSRFTAQARQPDGASHRDNVARAAGVFNFAALIASDTGIPGLATALWWRQHEIIADADTLTPDIAVIALMPLVNIARQQARQGDENTAFHTLNCLYRAAQQRGTATVHGHRVNLAPLTHGPAHRETFKELWAVLLTDGTRALTREGRWTDAAEIMAAHHGIGTRLLYGRQVKIMSLLEQGPHWTRPQAPRFACGACLDLLKPFEALPAAWSPFRRSLPSMSPSDARRRP